MKKTSDAEFLDQTVFNFIFGDENAGALDLLSDLACEGGYWETAEDFVKANGDELLRDLTPKQRAWCLRIKNDLEERTN